MEPGRASVTARRVAAQRLAFTRPDPGYGDPAADLALHRDVAGDVQAEATPMTRYLAARTAFFDEAVLSSTCPQVVVLAAGYDGRSLRFARQGVRWWELDHQDTQHDKLERLDRLGIDRSGVTFVAADLLTADVGASLVGAGLDPEVPTLLLCEGVIAYLPHDVTGRVLTEVARPGCTLVAEIPVDEAVADVGTREALRASVARVGETMAEPWPRDLGPVLAAYGWQVEAAVDARGVEIGVSELTGAFVVATGMQD